MANDIHSGHRERLKARFIKDGLESFEPHQVLELLLFYAIPRRDTNPLAHDLIETFGSLPAVLEATPAELCKVKGIGPHAASLISLCGQLVARHQQEKRRKVDTFESVEMIGEYLRPLFINERREKAVLVCLNNRMELLNCSVLSTGTITETDARARDIVELALRYQATNVVLAHNHPAGFAKPSTADLGTTRYLVKSLAMVDIHLLDHFIFAPDDYVSLRRTPQYAPIFPNAFSGRQEPKNPLFP